LLINNSFEIVANQIDFTTSTKQLNEVNKIKGKENGNGNILPIIIIIVNKKD
jgi:hypothetical protein